MTSHPSKFTSITPHFFKVILDETIRDGKLGIPRNFVRKHGNRLPRTIQLEVPSGATWKVELTKCDKEIWLQKGWQEFAEHYSLEFGYFVVFRYDGIGRFHVLVFDKSASEIEYPNANTEDDDDNMSAEHFEDVSVLSRKSKEKPNLPCPRPLKKIRTDSPDQPAGTDLEVEILSSSFGSDHSMSGRIKLGNLKEVEKSRCSTGQLDDANDVGGIAAPTPRNVKTEVLSCAQRLTAAEKARAIQIASAFKCTRNPAFMVVMQPSFVGNQYRMGIPIDFVRKYLTLRNGNLTLCDSTRKTWPARYFIMSENEKPRPYMHGGWRDFAVDKNLGVGDICVFELIKHSEILLKVVIYPVVENASKACRPLSNGSIGSRVKVRSLVCTNTERNCRQSQCPSSSREFKDPKIEENDEIVEVFDDFPPNQKTKKKLTSPCFQPSKMMTRTNPSGSIQTKRIKLDRHKKRVNSRYLTKELKGEFKYFVKDESEGMSAARIRGLIPGVVDNMQSLIPTEKERPTTFNSENPSFTLVMQPSYVLFWFAVHIPYQFAKRYFKKNGELTLRVPDGRTWMVEHKVCSLYAKARFNYKSWRAFVLDNNLKVGDTCVFELIKNDGILLEVAIFRAAGCSSSKLVSRNLLCPSPRPQKKLRTDSPDQPAGTDLELEILSSSFGADDPKSGRIKVGNLKKVEKSRCSMGQLGANGSIGSRVKVRSLVGNTERNCSQSQCPSRSREYCKDPKMEGNEIIEILDDFPLTRKTKKKSTSPFFQPYKMMRTNPSGGIKLEKQKKNPSFTILMQPSYVVSWFTVNIPYKFAKRYLEKNCEVTLRVSDGRTWIVDYKICSLLGRARFDSNSWKAFSVDNNLKVGDTCVFELIKENGILLEVAIFPAAG